MVVVCTWINNKTIGKLYKLSIEQCGMGLKHFIILAFAMDVGSDRFPIISIANDMHI